MEVRLFLKDNEKYVFETLWRTMEVKSTELHGQLIYSFWFN